MIFLARKPNILSSTFSIMLFVFILSVSILYYVINLQDDVANLQHDFSLQCVSHWALVNELTFQPAKCENHPISREQNSFITVYSLNSVYLNTVCSSRDLGIVVAKDLKWVAHMYKRG